MLAVRSFDASGLSIDCLKRHVFWLCEDISTGWGWEWVLETRVRCLDKWELRQLAWRYVAVGLPMAVYGESEWSYAASPVQKPNYAKHAILLPAMQGTRYGVSASSLPLVLLVYAVCVSVRLPTSVYGLCVRLLFMDNASRGMRLVVMQQLLCWMHNVMQLINMKQPTYMPLQEYCINVYECNTISYNGMIYRLRWCSDYFWDNPFYAKAWCLKIIECLDLFIKQAVGGRAHRSLHLQCPFDFYASAWFLASPWQDCLQFTHHNWDSLSFSAVFVYVFQFGICDSLGNYLLALKPLHGWVSPRTPLTRPFYTTWLHIRLPWDVRCLRFKQS